MKSRVETITQEISITKEIITSPGAEPSSFPTTTTVMGAVGVVMVDSRPRSASHPPIRDPATNVLPDRHNIKVSKQKLAGMTPSWIWICIAAWEVEAA